MNIRIFIICAAPAFETQFKRCKNASSVAVGQVALHCCACSLGLGEAGQNLSIVRYSVLALARNFTDQLGGKAVLTRHRIWIFIAFGCRSCH